MVALLLAVADAACPVEKDVIPPNLLKKLQPGKITGFLCLGNIGSLIVHSLRRICTDLKRVAGPCEDEASLPETLVRTHRLPQIRATADVKGLRVSRERAKPAGPC